MRDTVVIWDLEDDPDGNYAHIVLEHGITQDEVDDVIGNPNERNGTERFDRPTSDLWVDADR
jgi:hypothetical protein